MIRWISWGRDAFMRACDMVHYERGTKLRYGLGPTSDRAVDAGLRRFHESAAILGARLSARDWLVGGTVSYADFRMATFLPFNDVARLPLADYPAVACWYGRLEAIGAWRDPFQGLDIPELPPLAASGPVSGS